MCKKIIKMIDVSSIEADFEKMEISLLGKSGGSLGSMECSNVYFLMERFGEMTKYLNESIKGRGIVVHLPHSQKIAISNNSGKCDSLFMDFSSGQD